MEKPSKTYLLFKETWKGDPPRALIKENDYKCP